MKRTHIYLLGIAIFFFHVINNRIWLGINMLPMGANEIEHINTALDTLNIIRHPTFIHLKMLFNAQYYYWPSFFYLPSAIWSLLFGPSYVGMIMSHAVYLAILFFSLFRIGERMDDSLTGLLALLIASFYPMIFQASRQYNTDLANTALVCFAIYLFLLSDDFRKVGYSLLFGLSCGVGLLVERLAAFVFFSLIPISIWLMHRTFIKKSVFTKKQLLNFIFALLIAVSMTAIYYYSWFIINFNYVTNMVGRPNEPIGNRPPFLTAPPFHYLYELINTHITFFFFLVFLVGVFNFRKIETKLKWLILLWIAVPYAIFTLVRWKLPSYTIPYIPAIALLSAAGIRRYHSKIWKGAVVFLIIIIGSLQFLFVSYGIELVPYGRYLGCFPYGFHLWPPPEAGSYHAPAKDYWNIKQVLKELKTEIGDKRYLRIGIIDDQHFDSNGPDKILRYFIRLTDLSNHVLIFYSDYEAFEFTITLDNFNFIIYIAPSSSSARWPTLKTVRYKEGLNTGGFFRGLTDEDLRVLESSLAKFNLKKKLRWGDEALVYLYAKQ